MKALILMFSLLTVGSANVWASNLLPYVEMPVESQNLLAFSSQGVQFKECQTCDLIKLKPTTKGVLFYEHNTLIELKEATELFVNGKHNSISIFYDRKTNTYDKIVFGGHIEVDHTTQRNSEVLVLEGGSL